MTGNGQNAISPINSFLSELEPRFKNQRAACQEPKPLIPNLKILGQPSTSEVRSATENVQNAISPIKSLLSELEPRFKNVPYRM